MNSSRNTPKPAECQCCGFETQKLTLFKDQDTTIAAGGGPRKEDFWRCKLCAETMTGTYDRYPNQQPSNTVVLQTLCYIGNVLLQAIRSKR